MIAANAGSAEVVKQLIAHGADVNAAESRKGQTALMWAAAEGHPDVVQVLIDNKADVNAASKSGFTALVFAAVKNDPKSVQKLLAAGADAELRAARRHQGAAGRGRPTRAPWLRPRWWMAAPIRMSPIRAEIRRCTPPRNPAMWNW